MRIAVASLQQESNSFAPAQTTLEDFIHDYLLEGPAVQGLRGTESEVSGFLDVIDAAGAEAVPVLAAHAVSGGPVRAAGFAELSRRLVDGLRAAGPLDGVLLGLHGAMVVEGTDDGSARVLAAVRTAVGDVPLAATVDSHANLTAAMMDEADILIPYRTYPHVDVRETGQRAARLLLEMLSGRLDPVLAVAKVPMLLPAETHLTDRQPMWSLWLHLETLRRNGTVVDGGLCPVQPWLDLPDLGFGVVVLTDGDPAAARTSADALARDAWALRHAFDVALVEPLEAVRRALAMDGRPVILAESADAPGAGSPGDGTAVLQALMELRVTDRVLLTLVDPEAVQACAAAGVGSRLTVSVGGKRGRYSAPVAVTGTVRRVGVAEFVFTAGYTGTVAKMGMTAVLDTGAIRVVLTERAVPPFDPALYRAVGLEPQEAKIVVVKSPAGFRAAYEPIAHAIIHVDSPGHSPPNLRRLSYVRRPLPCFPFEDPEDVLPAVWVGARSGARTHQRIREVR